MTSTCISSYTLRVPRGVGPGGQVQSHSLHTCALKSVHVTLGTKCTFTRNTTSGTLCKKYVLHCDEIIIDKVSALLAL